MLEEETKKREKLELSVSGAKSTKKTFHEIRTGTIAHTPEKQVHMGTLTTNVEVGETKAMKNGTNQGIRAAVSTMTRV